MDETNTSYTRYFIKDMNGFLLYHLPKPRFEWFHWELDMCDRDSEHFTMLFREGDTYWSLDWYWGSLNMEAVVDFFVEKTIDEKELLRKHGIFVKSGVSSRPDEGPWYFTTHNAANLWIYQTHGLDLGENSKASCRTRIIEFIWLL